MSNVVPCPECGRDIDAVEAALHNEYYECETYFGDLLEAPKNNPEDSGPYHQMEP